MMMVMLCVLSWREKGSKLGCQGRGAVGLADAACRQRGKGPVLASTREIVGCAGAEREVAASMHL